jgi:hypothetical protein
VKKGFRSVGDMLEGDVCEEGAPRLILMRILCYLEEWVKPVGDHSWSGLCPTRKLAQNVHRPVPVARTLVLWSTGAVGSCKKCLCKKLLAQG